jgi:heat shock protein HslJ/membrane-bound inhibitor of C-type lysozyme
MPLRCSVTLTAAAFAAAALAAAASGAKAAEPPVAFSCGGEAVGVEFSDGAAQVTRGGETIAMAQAPSASGARHEAKGDPSTSFWSKGANGTLTIRGEALPLCVPAASVFTATGNEPGWRVDIAPGAWLVYRPQDGDRLVVEPPPAPAIADGVTRYEGEAGGRKLTLDANPKLCRDTMTGMPRPMTVTVTVDGRTLSGCGGSPAALLAGPEWTAAEIAGVAVPAGEPVTLKFEETGHLSGQAPCNRYMGGFAIGGEGVTLGPLGSTMMACGDDAMKRERVFLDLMGKVNRFDIEDGALVLHAADGQTVRANR